MGIAFGNSFKCLGGVVSPSFLGVSHILAESTGTLPFSDDFRREYLGVLVRPSNWALLMKMFFLNYGAGCRLLVWSFFSALRNREFPFYPRRVIYLKGVTICSNINFLVSNAMV